MSTIQCCCLPPYHVTVCVRDCGGEGVPGATVTATGPGDFSETCTTEPTPSGFADCCSFTITENGSYTFSSLGTSVTVDLHGPQFVELCTPPGDYNYKVCAFCLYGCIQGVDAGPGVPSSVNRRPGATVTATQDGIEVGSGVLDDNGRCCFCVQAPSQSHDIVLTTPPPSGKYVSAETHVSLVGPFGSYYPSCSKLPGVHQVGFTPAPGWAFLCCGGCTEDCGCFDPIKDTLVLTNDYGSATLSGSSWAGTQTVYFPGCVDSYGVAVGTVISYSIGCSPSGAGGSSPPHPVTAALKFTMTANGVSYSGWAKLVITGCDPFEATADIPAAAASPLLAANPCFGPLSNTVSS